MTTADIRPWSYGILNWVVMIMQYCRKRILQFGWKIQKCSASPNVHECQYKLGSHLQFNDARFWLIWHTEKPSGFHTAPIKIYMRYWTTAWMSYELQKAAYIMISTQSCFKSKWKWTHCLLSIIQAFFSSWWDVSMIRIWCCCDGITSHIWQGDASEGHMAPSWAVLNSHTAFVEMLNVEWKEFQ